MNKQDIKEWLKSNQDSYDMDNLAGMIDDLISELASKWVNVEDGLPEDGQVVLAFKKASCDREWLYLCNYDDEVFIVPKLGVFEPQYWMLPVPPKASKLEGGE